MRKIIITFIIMLFLTGCSYISLPDFSGITFPSINNTTTTIDQEKNLEYLYNKVESFKVTNTNTCKNEIDELINKCTWQWMKQNDVNGFKVTGPNGNSIFLPAAGHYNEASPCNVGKKGYYLTSSSSNLLYLSRAYRFISSGNYISLDWHQNEYTIRPVSD